MLARILFSSLLLAFLAPLQASAEIAATAATAGIIEPYTEGLLWRVVRKGTPDSFVSGTIHLADPRVIDPREPVLAALERSRTFAAEINVEGLTRAERLEVESQPQGPSLEKLVGAAEFEGIAARLSAQGLSNAAIRQMKPWAAMFRISAERSRGNISLDERLANLARAQKMRILGLEWAAEQIAAFDAVPIASQVALLKHVAANREALDEFSEPTVRAWLARDLKGLMAVNDKIGSKYPKVAYDYWQFTKHIVFNRTILMHHRLYLPLRSGRLFVAVGALHLYGKRGLLAMLERDGYKIERIW